MLLEVGRVTRAHGLKGEVVVELVTDRAERLARGSRLTLDGPASRSLTVHRASLISGPQGGGRASRERWIVAFEGVGDRNAAEALKSRALLAVPIEDPAAIWVHHLIGVEVRDTHGATLGVVTAVEANPASDLMVLDGGGLVPMCFITGQAAPGAPLVVDIPEGLLD